MKKKGLLFGTLGASLLLVGGVFAAYTVTDNAGILGFKITPGTITTDQVGTVALQWGETDVSDVTNLQFGAEHAQTRNFIVKSTISEYNNQNQLVATDKAYLGTLDVSIEDTSGKASEAKKLIDYLQVEVIGYQYNHNVENDFDTETSVLATLNKTTTSAAIGLYSVPAGKQVSFKITLLDTAQPYISVINTDTVYLTVDWNKASGEQDESGTTRVYVPDPGWNEFYFYSYGGGKENASWPGQKITAKDDKGRYIVDLVEGQYFIFTESASSDNRYPEDGKDGMTIAGTHASETNIIFNWTSKEFLPETSYQYYLTGVNVSTWSLVSDYGLALDTNDTTQYVGQFTVVADADYKFVKADKTVWFGYEQIEEDTNNNGIDESRSLVKVGDGDNFQFKVAGTYKIYLKPGSYSVWIDKVTTPSA